MARPMDAAWSVLKAFPGHSVFSRYSNDDYIHDQNEMYGEVSPSFRSVSHYRHGTLHPALQPHPEKDDWGAALLQNAQNLRISPDLDPDPHDTVIRNRKKAELERLGLPENERKDITAEELFAGLSPEQVMAFLDRRTDGRILAVPTMDNEKEEPLSMTNMSHHIRPHYTVPAGFDESHMEPANTRTLSLFRTNNGSHVPAESLDRYPSRYYEAPTRPVDGFKGPTLTEEQMADLRRQAAQSPFNQYSTE